jgi:hypothetical protein
MISLFIVVYYHRIKKRKLQEELAEQKKTDIPGESLPGTPSVQAATLRPILTPNVDLTTIQPLPVPTPAVAVPIPSVPETPQLPPAQGGHITNDNQSQTQSPGYTPTNNDLIKTKD